MVLAQKVTKFYELLRLFKKIQYDDDDDGEDNNKKNTNNKEYNKKAKNWIFKYNLIYIGK